MKGIVIYEKGTFSKSGFGTRTTFDSHFLRTYNYTMIPIIIFLLSIAIQLAAAINAILLIRITGRKLAWILISLALALMASRRIVTFAALLFADKEIPLDISEIIALIISCLMLAGVLRIRQYFHSSRLAEDTLHKKGLQYRNLFNSMRDVVIVADMERNVIDANQPALRNLFGYELAEVIGKSARIFYADEEGYQFTGREIFNRKESVEGKIIKVDCRRKNGEVFKGEISALKLLDEIGAPIGNVGIYRDITEQQIAEENLKMSLSLHKATIESTTDGILVVDTEGRIASFNQKFLELWRIPDSVITSRDDNQALNFVLRQLKDPSGFISKVRELYSQPEAESFDTLEFRDGRTFERYSKPQKVDGNTVGRVWSFIDVTERKEAEMSLCESEGKFKSLSQEFNALLNAIPDNLTMQSPDLRVIWANQGAAKGLGRDVSELEGKYCYELWHRSRVPCKACPVQRSFRTGEKESETVHTPDGRVWDLRAVPIKDEHDKVVSVVEMGRDITEHRKLEAQLQQSQKMEAVGTLTGGIAHDFNNILTAIIGYGHILKMKLEQGSQLMTYTDQILASAERAANLTQSLLAFSRKQVINPKPVNLNEITASVEKLLLRIIGEDIELKTILNPPLPLFDKGGRREIMVLADAGQIEQVLMNLAANARDAMPEGGTLTIETGLEELEVDFLKTHEYGKPGIYAVITVTDIGHGMDEMTRQRIFEPFFTTKEVGKGTGLGLSMVYGIIKQHNGYINCYSEPGTGTTFRIYLPVIEKETEKAKKEEHITLSDGAETILLAEDEEEVRKLMKLVLEEAGYKVIEAVDGQETIEKFRENKDSINLLLLDMIMPKINGKGVYEEAKKIKPEIKALFSSGYPTDFIHKKGILEEGLNFISKPASPHELLKMIREILDK